MLFGTWRPTSGSRTMLRRRLPIVGCPMRKLLWERGLDPYAIWIARCREKGISSWLTMRMNDVHNVDDVDSYIHSKFWMEHPEYWRIPGGKGWTDRAFNYAIPEVREHHLKFIRELLERYDPDGLELDWMRFGYHFAPGQEQEGCAILTEFIREVTGTDTDMVRETGTPHPARCSCAYLAGIRQRTGYGCHSLGTTGPGGYAGADAVLGYR